MAETTRRHGLLPPTASARGTSRAALSSPAARRLLPGRAFRYGAPNETKGIRKEKAMSVAKAIEINRARMRGGRPCSSKIGKRQPVVWR